MACDLLTEPLVAKILKLFRFFFGKEPNWGQQLGRWRLESQKFCEFLLDDCKSLTPFFNYIFLINEINFYRLILLNKLLEDGNTLYKKNRLQEAALRYQYALNKFPTDALGEFASTFHQLRINFLLNQSRCKRKMNVSLLRIKQLKNLLFSNNIIVLIGFQRSHRTSDSSFKLKTRFVRSFLRSSQGKNGSQVSLNKTLNKKNVRVSFVVLTV